MGICDSASIGDQVEPQDSLDQVNIDLSGVGSAASRSTVSQLFFEFGRNPVALDVFWKSLESKASAERLPEHLLVVSDLSKCIRTFRSVGKRRWSSTIRSSLPFIIVLVRNERDRMQAALVDDLVEASERRLTVCEFEPRRAGSLAPCIARGLASLDKASVVDARYSREERAMWVEFGDGLRSVIPWSSVGIDEEEYGLALDSAAPSDDFASVEILKAGDSVFDVDSSSLRAIADQKYASELSLRASHSRETLGARVRAHREAAGLTQAQLAERSGLDQALISKLEVGRHQPRLDTLVRYANALGLSVTELLSEPGKPA